jgi:hypothetical protein
MMPRVCVCCGEPISEKENVFSRNPNMCASCSSLADGMDVADTSESFVPERQQPEAGEDPARIRKAA